MITAEQLKEVKDRTEQLHRHLNIDGKKTTEFPVTADLVKAKPVLQKLPGWKCEIRGIKDYDALPENCRNYIEFIEERIGYPITMVSNGPGRRDIIYRNK